MNTSDQVYQQWVENPLIDDDTRRELRSISNQPSEIEDRFYKHLDFGTGGIRGVLGAGTNRINRYTIRRITQGLANYILSKDPSAPKRGVVIAYDSRFQSKELALETAMTLVANGINAYLFPSTAPTPLLSFSVRKLQTIAGIVITASHNPPDYNGYKIYWEDGGQIVPTLASKILDEINSIQGIPSLTSSVGTDREIVWIGKEVEDEYIYRLKKTCIHPELIKETGKDLTIIYTPLHGTGSKLIRRTLKEVGFQKLTIVPEQEHPDPHFTTIKTPNPETKEAFTLGLALAKETQADIVLATDPDCDRVGTAVLNKNRKYEFLTGNQLGGLLFHYILSERRKQNNLPLNPVLITTIVSSKLGRIIAEKYGVETIETLTGFKYIGEKIRKLEQLGNQTFLFGYEESYGFLADSFVRDKDGIMATLLICEMAAFYKKQNKTLCDILEELYKEHGFFLESLESCTLEGKQGIQKIQRIMDAWRKKKPTRIGSLTIKRISDYLLQKTLDVPTQDVLKLDLPKENALQFTFTDGSWFCLRPSGTEPKIKIYFAAHGESEEETSKKLDEIKRKVMREINEQIKE